MKTVKQLMAEAFWDKLYDRPAYRSRGHDTEGSNFSDIKLGELPHSNVDVVSKSHPRDPDYHLSHWAMVHSEPENEHDASEYHVGHMNGLMELPHLTQADGFAHHADMNAAEIGHSGKHPLHGVFGGTKELNDKMVRKHFGPETALKNDTILYVPIHKDTPVKSEMGSVHDMPTLHGYTSHHALMEHIMHNWDPNDPNNEFGHTRVMAVHLPAGHVGTRSAAGMFQTGHTRAIMAPTALEHNGYSERNHEIAIGTHIPNFVSNRDGLTDWSRPTLTHKVIYHHFTPTYQEE